jgi:WS/DGAT/MGAT family acyltransferase
MSGREPLAGQDNAWRRMGRAENLMSITGVLIFEEPLGYEALCERLEERLLRFGRFRQRLGGQQRRFRRPYWTEMANMDVRSHVFEVALPEPADTEQFQRFIGTLTSQPLDEKRPLWQAYLIQNGGSGDGNAVAFRLNHSIGDGFALLSVLLGLVDNPEEIDLPAGSVSKVAGTETESGEKTVPAEQQEDSGSSPGMLRQTIEGIKTTKVGIERALALLTMDDDSQTSLHGPIGAKKEVAWTEEIDLATVKQIGQAHDATINDVLLGATAGGLRRLFEKRGEPTEDVEVRCTVPVNLKGIDERESAQGNYFGLAFIPIPVGERDLSERIRLVRDRTDKRTLGSEAVLVYQLLRIGGYVPFPIQQQVMNHFENKTMGVFTNVPGPTDTLELDSKEISDIMFWVPQSLDQGLGISIFSYAGGVRMGVNSDANLLAEPQELTDAFEAEIEMLVAQTD